jgi:hypothetical protein
MDDKALEEKAFEFCEKSGCLHGASLTTLLREVAKEARREAEEMLREEHDARMEALAQRDEARATKDMHKERQEEAWAEVERLRAALDKTGEWVAAVDPKLPMPGRGDSQQEVLNVIELALSGEVERLRYEAEVDKLLADAIYQREEKEKAEAEVERLREALVDAAGVPVADLLDQVADHLHAEGGGPMEDRCRLAAVALRGEG